MSDETTTQEVTPEPEAPEAVETVEEAQSLTDEQVAEYLGYEDVDQVQKARGLAGWEKKLRHESMDKSTQEPEPEPVAPTPETPDEDYEDLDPRAKKLLGRYITQELGIDPEDFKYVRELAEYQGEDLKQRSLNAIDEAMDSVDAPSDEVFRIMQENDLVVNPRTNRPYTPTQLRGNVEKAANIYKANNLDTIISEKVKEALEGKVGEGEEVVEVTPKREGPSDDTPQDFDDVEDPDEAYRIVLENERKRKRG